MSEGGDEVDGIRFISMPGIKREAFESEEDYLRAKETSEALPPGLGDPGSEVFIFDALIVDAIVALINEAKAVGYGVLHDRDVTREEVAEWVSKWNEEPSGRVYLDYVCGRPIKIKPLERAEADGHLGWKFNTDLYNRDQGAGKAELILRMLGHE